MIFVPGSKKTIPIILTVCLLLIACTLPALARTSSVRYFRLGEADYVVAGDTATTSVDSSRYPLRSDLTVVGSPVYSADVGNANSSLSLQFNGSQYAITLNSYNLTTNFGVEAWVKPSSTGTDDRYIVYSGDPAGSGWGIVQRGTTGQFQALFGGRTYLGAGNITVGQWTHLAFVCTATNATFYVNGVPSGTPVAQLPSDTDVTIAIGADASDPSTNLFQGNIDEVRVFAFADGEFVPTDLLYTVRPLVLALQRQAGQSTLTWPEIFPQYGVESTTDLTTTNGWTPFSGSTMAYDQFSITDTNNNNAQFYRLSTMAVVQMPPALPAGQYIVLNDLDVPSSHNITDPNSSTANAFYGIDNIALDASGFVDLSIPNGTVDDLNFHWVITYPGLVGTYSDQGITGYFSPVLQIMPNSLANDAGANAPTFTLTVTSKTHPSLGTVVQIHAGITHSALSITIYSACLGQTTVGKFCTIANALPTTQPH